MQSFNQYFDAQARILIKKAENLSKRSDRQFVYRAAILTVYGFQVVIPVLIGIFVGLLLDKNFPLEHIAWTLNFILLGFLIGLYNANTWFYRMMELHKTRKYKQKGGKK